MYCTHLQAQPYSSRSNVLNGLAYTMRQVRLADA
jgi:hypothetical protein